MSFKHHGDRVHFHIGDVTNPDDPRGREFGANIELGVATGEFDYLYSLTPRHLRPEFGSWGFWVTFWQWGISLVFRGPVLGHYPPSEDDE